MILVDTSVFLAIGHRAVPDAADTEHGAGLGEEQPVVPDLQAEFAGVLSVELFDIALSGAGKAQQSVEDAPGSGLVEAADVGAGFFRPLDVEGHFFPPRPPLLNQEGNLRTPLLD